jgi:hypothetical protein
VATRRTHELRQTTLDDYRWRLSRHLLPFFRAYRPSEIDIDLVDRHREHKLIERDEITRAQAAGVVLRDAEGRPQRPLGNAEPSSSPTSSTRCSMRRGN